MGAEGKWRHCVSQEGLYQQQSRKRPNVWMVCTDCFGEQADIRQPEETELQWESLLDIFVLGEDYCKYPGLRKPMEA